jgi:hypothetical protein
MGLFSKKKSDDPERIGVEKIGVKGMPVNPKFLGGPSTTPLSPDDPLLQPVDGISLADYAAVARECQARKITDEAGMNQVASEMGYDAAVFGPATKEWIARMGKSMVVGQEFRRHLGY